MASNPDKANDIFHKLTALGGTSPTSTPMAPQTSRRPVPQVQPQVESTAIPSMTQFGNVSGQSHMQRMHKTIQKRVPSSDANPEDAGSFEEQLSLIGNQLFNKILNGQNTSALAYSIQWIDGIINEETNTMYPEVSNMLTRLTQPELVKFIEVLLSTFK